MDNNSINGVEIGLNKMIMYYAIALKESGIENIKEYMASKMVDMIQLSADESEIIMLNILKDNQTLNGLKKSIELLDTISITNNNDKESIKIIKNILNLVVNDLIAFNNTIGEQ